MEAINGDAIRSNEATKNNPSLQVSARNTEVGDRFNRTMFAAVDSLEKKGISYALIGGVAVSGHSRPRSTHDIDIFVRPEDAACALDALEASSFSTQRTDPNWLFKAFKEDILVDIIFKSEGDIYFDEEMRTRAVLVTYHGRKVRVVSPEDLVIIKCAVHTEVGPHHWHDALAILSHATLDWNYLLKRARRAPRRLLALLLYAQSNDILIPNHIIIEMFRTIFGDMTGDGKISTAFGGSEQNKTLTHAPQSAPQPLRSVSARRDYLVGRIQDAIACDERTSEHNTRVTIIDKRILIIGEAPTATHRQAIENVVRDLAPEFDIDNQIKVSNLPGPEGAESVA